MKKRNINLVTILGFILFLGFANAWGMMDELKEGSDQKPKMFEYGYQIESQSNGILDSLYKIKEISSPSKKISSPVKNSFSPIKGMGSLYEPIVDGSTFIKISLNSILEEYKKFAKVVASEAFEGNSLCQQGLFGQYVTQNLNTLENVIKDLESYDLSSLSLKFRSFCPCENGNGAKQYSIRILTVLHKNK